ncbi:Sieve element occlusion b [Quillaja saponaria]|uniref:Sieve element occlusion b n=1 Tax=Quillaja saponaria TaxID=32244 RepID=A0AAD7KWN1_QUISA|nr:Sieve element occlusion b [Quillaja saponaria]
MSLNVGPVLYLSSFGQDLNIILNRLKRHLSLVKQQLGLNISEREIANLKQIFEGLRKKVISTRVLHLNAMHMIQVWGVKAFPFTDAREEELDREEQWIGIVVTRLIQF